MDLTHNIIEYVNCCVGAFANRFKLTLAQSYAYLRRFKAIDFLIDCYAAEHTRKRNRNWCCEIKNENLPYALTQIGR